MNKNNISTTIITVFLSSMSVFIQKYGYIVSLVFISMILDVITGTIKSKILGTTNSGTGFIGFWKKISLLVALLFGFFLDLAEGYILSCISNNDAFTVRFAFGILIGLYIMLNECISICENLQLCGVKLPKFVMKALVKQKQEADEGSHLHNRKHE